MANPAILAAPATGEAAAASDWVSCARCRVLLYRPRIERTQWVCPECGHHGRLSAPQRVALLLDPGSAQALPEPRVPVDPLGFVDTRPYPGRLADARANTGLTEAVVCARGTIMDRPLVVAVMDFAFLGGSLGTAVGERIVRAAETALAERVPLVLVTASGGARMQEGALALMQMVKTSQALAELDEAGLLTVTLVTDPTYGGVAASFATLGDIVVAEPGARLGFAGPRVIQQTTRQPLPEGFQTAEFLLEHGLVDLVQARVGIRPLLSRVIGVAADAARPCTAPARSPVVRSVDDLPERDALEVMALARHQQRPSTMDYAREMLEDFQELHGDRMSADCPAVVAGIGRLAGASVVFIGHEKGRDLRERTRRNFGMARPEGYRKAARLMRLAAKLGIPVVTLVDTPGADPGAAAEEHGQAVAIAENLRLMSSLPVPVVTVVIGEGGSGGALALGVADRVLAMENSFYSVISPEGCAAILWKSPKATAQAARALRISARELLAMGIVDGVVPEPEGGAHRDPLHAVDLVRDAVATELAELARLHQRDPAELVRARRRRFRRFGA